MYFRVAAFLWIHALFRSPSCLKFPTMSVSVFSNRRALCVMALWAAAFSSVAAPDSNEITQPKNPDAASVKGIGFIETPRLTRMSQQEFLHLLVARSIEIQYSKLSADVAGFLKTGEGALYEPTTFLAVREEGRLRQRTSEEVTQNFNTRNTALLDENGRSTEFGVRGKLPTGADVSLSYKLSRKSNNLIPQTTQGRFDTEHNALLNLTLKQPLMRNAGRSVTETDRRVAELEHQISLQQLTQQTFKSCIDGLTVYWQLHRAQETVTLRQEALASTQALLSDGKNRVTAGRAPESTLLELQGALLNRQAELVRSQQALVDAQSKLSTAVHVPWNQTLAIQTQPTFMSLNQQLPSSAAEDDALRLWPPYQIALLKQQQAQTRLQFAMNQTQPVVDLVLSYGGTGYNNQSQAARNFADKGTYPDWYFGVNIELPLKGNQKAEQQYLAQSTRLLQSETELLAIRNSFGNDLQVRFSDLNRTQQIIQSSQHDVTLRQTIFINERQRVDLGVGLLGALIQKQVDLTEAKQRLLENQIRFETAMATWQYAQGRLLADHHILVSDASRLE
jgi:outer membrane protein TolC